MNSQSGNDKPIQSFLTAERHIHTVSELTTKLKSLLEDNFPFVWICGEISNFRMPVSGHFYCTLKDEEAQINAVMFRGQNRNLKFKPEDGMVITGLGRISVYEPRGTYQILLEYLEPKDIGAIQMAFEQLKTRLATEGLFDEKHKKPLPFLPRRISIITSPTGSVVHDIVTIINRRFPNVHLEVVPVKVQGNGAEKDIAAAIDLLNIRRNTNVAILARGGGSVEDLQAFNSEDVARAVFASEIPIISAVGHETDFTIADFVADLRASTPSAAAELVIPLKNDLQQRCTQLSEKLATAFSRYMEHLHTCFDTIRKHLVDPKKKIHDLRLRMDDLTARYSRAFTDKLRQRSERLEWLAERLNANNPLQHIKNINEKIEQINYNLLKYLRIYKDNKYYVLRELNSKLHALSPTAILDRGYSITRTIPEATIISNPDAVSIGQVLEVMLAKGSLMCRVERKSSDGKKNI